MSDEVLELGRRARIASRAVAKAGTESAPATASKEKPAVRVADHIVAAPIGLPKPKTASAHMPATANAPATSEPQAPALEPVEARQPGRVVQLDTFRKK